MSHNALCEGLDDARKRLQELAGMAADDPDRLLSILPAALEDMRHSIDDLREQIDALIAEKEAVSTERQWLRSLVETIPHGIQEIDETGVTLFSNAAHHRMFGYDDGELTGVSIMDLLEDDGERDELKRYLEYLVRKQPTPMPYLTQCRTKYGRVIDVQVDWTYKRDGRGRVVGFVSVITEITERKEAEERIRGLNKELQQRVIERTGELEESRRTFETLMKNLPGMFYRCRNDKNWTLEFADEGSAALTGYPVEKLLAGEIHYSDLMHVDDRERVWTEVQRAVAAYRPFQLEYRIMSADGTQKWVLERGCAIRAADGSVEALEGVLLDVTDRKRAEEELRLAAQITANMVEGINLTSAADGIIVYTNRRFEEMFGYGPGEMVGRPIAMVNAPGDHTPEETFEKIVASIETDGFWCGEIHNIKKDRTNFWTYANISTFDHPAFGPVWLTVQQDITDRKDAEARTRQHQAESAHFQRLATLGEMASGLAHEVNQPLAAIA
ncbi:MAG: PAS domain S-box protein, partial [Planctomycetes bacterium]|nr:PAS domain S-box protein [Planctomycetota bacterium]